MIKEMVKEKLAVRKVLIIIVLTAIGTVTFGLLYLGILFLSLPLTLNMMVSWILSLSITIGIILLIGIYALKKKKGDNYMVRSEELIPHKNENKTKIAKKFNQAKDREK